MPFLLRVLLGADGCCREQLAERARGVAGRSGDATGAKESAGIVFPRYTVILKTTKGRVTTRPGVDETVDFLGRF